MMYEIQTYLGADGLMHCTVCKEPVEAFYPKGSLLEMRKHHRQCACERKAYAEEAQYYKEKEHRELIARNKKICFEEKEMEGFTFQNVERDSGVIRIAEEYVTNWQKMKQNHMGYLFWGPVGTGKSYLACALGHEACKRGFRTFYANAPKLLGALKVAKVKGTLETELKKIERCQLLILDDLFIVPLDAKERPILLEIIEDRHERKSIIITSQYPSSNWYDMVGDPTIADAILDRIIHTAHTIELYGESMRKLRSKKNGKF